MIRRGNECQIEYREHMRDGDGTVQLTNFITGPAELCGKGRLFSRLTLNPGCGIGYHVHEGDSELFFILKGTAEYSDNGTICQVSAGDVTICPPGQGHSITTRQRKLWRSLPWSYTTDPAGLRERNCISYSVYLYSHVPFKI